MLNESRLLIGSAFTISPLHRLWWCCLYAINGHGVRTAGLKLDTEQTNCAVAWYISRTAGLACHCNSRAPAPRLRFQRGWGGAGCR